MSAEIKVIWRRGASGVRAASLEVSGATREAQAKLVLEVESWPRRAFAGDSEAAQRAAARQLLLDALEALAGDAAIELVEDGAEGSLAGTVCALLPGHYWLKGRCGVCAPSLAAHAAGGEASAAGGWSAWQRHNAALYQAASRAAYNGRRAAALQLKELADGRAAGAMTCAPPWRYARLCKG